MCPMANYRIPDNEAFWSITVYGNDDALRAIIKVSILPV
jgi:hypothetical protein